MTESAWPTCTIPAVPPARGYEASPVAELTPRYDDVTQDGRVQLMALMPALGAVWRSLGTSEKLESFQARGVLPILRRLVVTHERGPFSAHHPIHIAATWRLAREDGDGGRIFLNMWAEAHAPIASTFGPRPAPDAERVLVGRVYAEHVITRPFAPATERKVIRLDVPGLPEVPEDLIAFEEAEDLVAGRTLEPAGEHLFGVMHTDSNRHVNSLVYPRLFEEALLRSIGPNAATFVAQAVELRYRKPCFAGDRAEIVLAAEAFSGGAVAVGAFRPAGAGPAAKPSCTVAMRLG